MFPDLTRDDVFTLETRRLWLRWPRAVDAPAIRRIASRAEVAEMTAAIPHPYPADGAEAFVLAARAANAEGREIALVITLKATREVIGLVSASSEDSVELGFVLAPAHWGKGYATETARAVIDAVDEISRSGQGLHPLRRRRRRLCLVPAREVHRIRRPGRRRRRARRRRHRRMRRRASTR
jgi:RimJ/RimL family protein N-acetyltransferase